MNKKINVTESFVPPLEEYTSIVKKAFDAKWLTNRGSLVCQLEDELREYLGVNCLTLTTNGTLPIQLAIKAMELSGEIITTPFSYVATTSSIVWENCTPVFVDIDAKNLTIDESKIEEKITKKTTAIIATHVFGNPCHVEEIGRLAKKYKLKVIYDAAHCFGVKFKGKSIFNYGDISTCSFHSTKVFHTGEGGAWFCNDEKLNKKMYYHHNFGHDGPIKFHGLGINAKISELQGAMGLAVLPYMNSILIDRKRAHLKYKDLLLQGSYQLFEPRTNIDWNYHYFPIIFNTEENLLNVLKALNDNDIYPRRYFSPSLNTLPYVQYDSMPISESISSRILCLPLYYDMSDTDIGRISSIINQSE